jgi:hypothetical protein
LALAIGLPQAKGPDAGASEVKKIWQLTKFSQANDIIFFVKRQVFRASSAASRCQYLLPSTPDLMRTVPIAWIFGCLDFDMKG